MKFIKHGYDKLERDNRTNFGNDNSVQRRFSPFGNSSNTPNNCIRGSELSHGLVRGYTRQSQARHKTLILSAAWVFLFAVFCFILLGSVKAASNDIIVRLVVTDITFADKICFYERNFFNETNFTNMRLIKCIEPNENLTLLQASDYEIVVIAKKKRMLEELPRTLMAEERLLLYALLLLFSIIFIILLIKRR